MIARQRFASRFASESEVTRLFKLRAMNATTTPLSTILSDRARYTAPLFQRPYVWSREANWEPLWETVREVADHYEAGLAVRPRFLGAIVLEQLPVPVGQVTTRQIIDGQQRLTTLQILLAAARDFGRGRCAQNGWATLLDVPFTQLTSNYEPLALAEEKFKVWPTNADRIHFERVMTAGSPAKLAEKYGAPPKWQEGPKSKPRDYELGIGSDSQVQRALDFWDGWSEEERGVEWKALSAAQQSEVRGHNKKYDSADHRMVGAYWFFWSSLAIWLDTDDYDVFAGRMQALLNAVQTGLVLVSINLDAGEDAQLIFETMNARGLPLSPADLVKNFLFREAQLAGADVEQEYQSHWAKFDHDTWWRQEVRQGRLKRPRIDAFLWNYLTLTTKREVLSADLFSSYRDWALSSGNTLSPSEQIARFAHYGDIFREFEIPTQPERVRAFIERLAVLDVSTIYPLLLELFGRYRFQQTTLEEILVDLESYLVRRLLVGLTTKNYNRFFFDLLQKLESGNDFSPVAVRAALLEGTSNSTRWPDDDELKKALVIRPLYGFIKVERLAYVLQTLDKEMHTSKGEAYTITGKLTIEHLLPQKWAEHWPLPADKETEDTIQTRENLLHTLGNLTLVTGQLNSALSNSAWSVKHSEIQKHSGIMFNHSLPAVWDEDAIKARSEELFGYTKAIWPYPLNSS